MDLNYKIIKGEHIRSMLLDMMGKLVHIRSCQQYEKKLANDSDLM